MCRWDVKETIWGLSTPLIHPPGPLRLSRYTRDDEMGEEAEETGWKYLHGDVFRFPPHINTFSAMMGVGTQASGSQLYQGMFKRVLSVSRLV